LIYHMRQRPKPFPAGVPTVVPVAPSLANLRAIFLRAIELGRVRMSQHFRDQSYARRFSTLDAEQILEEGEVIFGPIHDSAHGSWKCEIYSKVEGRGWNLVVALDCTADYCESPLLHLITVHRVGLKRAKAKSKRG